jgi:putative ABC transport system permease protein
MIRNYLKIALRNLLKHKFISAINLFGLTVGISCCLLILAYILHELSYDKYNKQANNIYRVEDAFYNAETGAVNLALFLPDRYFMVDLSGGCYTGYNYRLLYYKLSGS